ncbi:MAG: DUF6580 family putative transport protein, partial [Bacteroidota bacterium]
MPYNILMAAKLKIIADKPGGGFTFAFQLTDIFMLETSHFKKVLPALALILLAAASRLLPHPPNFAPLGAMALFGAAVFDKRWLAILVTLMALYLSDLVLNNVVYAQYQPTFTWAVSVGTYLGFLAFVGIGFLFLRNRDWNVGRIVGAVLAGTAVFFVLTNFLAWYLDPFDMYADDAVGLSASYTAALPFLLNSLLGNLFFSAVLFGGYAWLEQRQASK